MAVAQGAAEARAGWARGVLNWFFNRKAAPIWLLLAIVSLAFWPTYLEWWARWTMYQSAFGYGYLIPPTVLFLIWCRRNQIAEEPRTTGHWLVLIPIVFAVLLHCVALLARVNVLQSLSFFILTMTLPYYLWGGAVYRHIWGALAYSATMLPWPPQIYAKLLLPAQEISTKIAVKMLGWTGVATEVTNNTTVATNHGYNFEVAAACSGLTIVFPIVAIVILSVMMIKAPWWKIVFLLLLAVPLAVFSNAVRIWTIAMIGDKGNADLANRLHDPSGIAAVIFASILLVIIMSVIKAMEYKPEYMPAFAKIDEEDESE
jgi:exosortase